MVLNVIGIGAVWCSLRDVLLDAAFRLLDWTTSSNESPRERELESEPSPRERELVHDLVTATIYDPTLEGPALPLFWA